MKYFEKLEIREHMRYYTQNPKLILRKMEAEPADFNEYMNLQGTTVSLPSIRDRKTAIKQGVTNIVS